MVDFSFLNSFTKGNEVKIKRYINMYLQVAPETFTRMEEDIKIQNWTDLAISAHSLKPQADFMGLPDLKATLIEIEDQVKAGQTAELKSLFEKAQRLHLEAKPFLEERA